MTTATQAAAEARARARLRSMTAADTAPVLSEAQITELLALCRLADAAGEVPLSDDWSPSYDLNRGAAEGWRWKAAKVATAYDFTADGANFQRSQMREACEKQAAVYARRIVTSAVVFAPLTTVEVDDDEA